MRPFLLIATLALGITTAEAQTAPANGVGSDPLSVPTSSSPGGLSLSTGSISAGAANGSTGGNSASGISASSSNTSQVPLQLPGETPNSSTQAATSTAAAANHSTAPICPPPVPTSDGGSANLTDMVGGSLSGC